MKEITHFLNYFLIFVGSFALIELFLGKKKLPVYTFFIILYLILGKLNLFNKEILNINYQFVYEFLLPIILFESAININIHRFKIQFKTLTFLTTIALVFNAVIVSLLIKIFFGVPFLQSLIFGTLISATDPIGVLAFVKKIKIPERLKLIIEGESLLNDATTIIFFELIILSIFNIHKNNNILFTFINLLSLKFFLSIFFGFIFGFILNTLTNLFKNDLKICNILILPLVIISYLLIEHLHLSGPIFIIFAGIVFSNFSFVYFQEKEFEKEKYFFSLLVILINIYFFATVSINIEINFLKHIFHLIDFLKINLIIFIARSLTVYLSFFVTNKNHFFFDEPDIYPSWQHIINFSGLRGVIPLILVNQLPNDFIYKKLFYDFTIYAFIFTNLINPFIVIFLIKKYEKLFYSKIYLAKKLIYELLNEIRKHFHLKDDLKIIKKFSTKTKKEVINLINKEISKNKDKIKKMFAEISKLSVNELVKSLHLLGAQIEKESHLKTYKENQISYYDLIWLLSELDLHVDSLLYPEKFFNRVVDKKGFIINKKSLRLKILNLLPNFNLFFVKKKQEQLIKNQQQVIFERIISSVRVIDTFKIIYKFKGTPKKLTQAVKQIEKDHSFFIKYYFEKLSLLPYKLR